MLHFIIALSTNRSMLSTARGLGSVLRLRKLRTEACAQRENWRMTSFRKLFNLVYNNCEECPWRYLHAAQSLCSIPESSVSARNLRGLNAMVLPWYNSLTAS